MHRTSFANAVHQELKLLPPFATTGLNTWFRDMRQLSKSWMTVRLDGGARSVRLLEKTESPTEMTDKRFTYATGAHHAPRLHKEIPTAPLWRFNNSVLQLGGSAESAGVKAGVPRAAFYVSSAAHCSLFPPNPGLAIPDLQSG